MNATKLDGITNTTILPIANEPATGSMREHLAGALARVIPRDIRIATAYLTPDGFLDLKDGMENAASIRLLLGERPLLNQRGVAAINPSATAGWL